MRLDDALVDAHTPTSMTSPEKPTPAERGEESAMLRRLSRSERVGPQLPSLHRSSISAIWRDAEAWIAALFSFASMSAEEAHRFGSWTVLVTQGDIFPIALFSVVVGLLVFAARRGKRE